MARLVIFVQGGCVQDVLADSEVEVIVLDQDLPVCGGADARQVLDLPGSVAAAILWGIIHVDAAFVQDIFDQVEQED